MVRIPAIRKHQAIFAALFSAVLLPCAAQTVGGPSDPFGAPGARVQGRNTLPAPFVSPSVQTQMTGSTAVPGMVFAPVPGTVTTNTIVEGPVVFGPTTGSTTLLSLQSSVSTLSSQPQPPVATSLGGIVNPSASSLQSTIGTIETGSASTRPELVSAAPLNMAPVGYALNSDLNSPAVMAALARPATQAMGAGPAPVQAEAARATPAPKPRQPLVSRGRADRN